MPRLLLADVVKGEIFSDWVALTRTFYKTGSGGNNYKFVTCRCSCGTVRDIPMASLRRKDSTHCGCKRTKHGMARKGNRDREYDTWSQMKGRCYRQEDAHYHNYGGRGIKICDRWLNSFENFFADMGRRPSHKHSIERRNNNLGYSPENCYWATRIEQSANLRTNHNITFNGETLNISEWGRRLGVDRTTVLYRIRKWGIERALSTTKLR